MSVIMLERHGIRNLREWVPALGALNSSGYIDSDLNVYTNHGTATKREYSYLHLLSSLCYLWVFVTCTRVIRY